MVHLVFLVLGLLLHQSVGACENIKMVESNIVNRYIVVLESDDVPAGSDGFQLRTAVLSELAAAIGGRVLKVYRSALNGGVIEMSESAAAETGMKPGVSYVEEDARVSTSEQGN